MKKKFLSAILCLCMVVGMVPALVVPALAYTTGDTYPSEYKNAVADSLDDRWNFYNRECTSFVAWCLNDRNGVGFSNWYGGVLWGNANNWGTAARSLGIAVDLTPAIGAVAWWDYGHVAWVSAVNGDSVTIEEYNYGYTYSWHTRNISRASVSGYIHIKDIGGSSQPSVTFSPWNQDGYTYISQTNASIGQHISVSNGNCTDTGMYLYDASGRQVASASNGSYSSSTPKIYFNINEECRYTLSPGMTYKYKFYAIVNGKTYWSQEYSFTTDGTAYPTAALNPGKDFYAYISYPNGHMNLENRSNNVQTSAKNSTDSRQIWHFVRLSDGTYNIINVYDGRYLDVLNRGDSGTNVWTYTGNGDPAQKWKIVSDAYGMSGAYNLLISYNNSLALDINDASTSSGANAQVWTRNATVAQAFQIDQLAKNTVSVNAGPSAGGKVSGGGKYYCFESATVEATANSGYTFKGWTENGKTVSTSASYSFAVSTNRTLTAVFEKEQVQNYTVTAGASPAAGGTVNGSGTYQAGANATVTATPKEGYVFKGWTENGSTVSTNASYTFTVSTNRILVAVFEKAPAVTPSYIITTKASPTAGGTVTGDGQYLVGTEVTVTATPNKDYVFKGWTENGRTVDSSSSYQFTVEASRDLTAVFENEQAPNYTVTANASLSQGGTVTGNGTYQANANVTVTATPKDGYVFKGWMENSNTVSTNASYTFTINANRSLTAVFEKAEAVPPEITVWPAALAISYGQKLSDSTLSGGRADVSGTFRWADPSTIARAGQSYGVIFTPSDTERYTLVNGNVSVTVNKSTPKLSVSVQQSGTLVMVSVLTSNPYNTDLTDVPAPSMTYQIGNGTAQSVTGGSFTIPEDTQNGAIVTVTASTAENENYQAAEKSTTLTVTNIMDETVYHVLTTSSSLGGSVSIQPDSAKPGETVTVTAVPRNGYTLEGVVAATDTNGAAVHLTSLGDGRYTFTMPEGNVTLDAVFESTQAVWVNPFSDIIEGAWYYDAVRFVNHEGLMNGIQSDIFSPNSNLSRAQLAQILYLHSRASTTASSGFTDVPAGQWYSNAVAWAVNRGIVSGYGNGRFGPDDSITREQLAVMLWRYAGEPAFSGGTLNFTDAGRISGYAREAVGWAVENGIISGKGGGILEPQGPATRAQVAQMLKNFLEK